MRGIRRRWAALSLLLATFVAGCQAAGPAVTRPPSAEQSAAVLAAAAGPAPSTAEPTMGARAAVDVLVASPTRSLTQLPFYVGLAAGLFAEEGLNATMINMASPVAIAAVIDGQVGYTTAGGTTIRAAASGRPVRLIAGGNNRPDWDLMVQPGIPRVEALRGKRLGVQAPTGATTLVTYELLARYGLGRADVEAINLQTTDGILQGLVARQVDAGPLGAPHNVMARREGLQSLLRTGDEVMLLQGGVGTSSQRLQERPAEVEAFLRALLRSIRLLRADRAKTLGVLVDEYALAPDVAEVVYDEGVANFVPDASASDAAIQREITAQEEAIGQKLDVTPAQVADFEPLHRAQAALGIPPAP